MEYYGTGLWMPSVKQQLIQYRHAAFRIPRASSILSRLLTMLLPNHLFSTPSSRIFVNDNPVSLPFWIKASHDFSSRVKTCLMNLIPFSLHARVGAPAKKRLTPTFRVLREAIGLRRSRRRER